ncbi:hypothetical protein SCP_0312230 [Sparassis crispa]|uniref:Uncharacterized protein n=1 Tax=Sparassis crispa TaxID=139825 RepID=A0A401GH18_9APHY|nr:hypothetical protein SCP_0312230 [Sparassis crispa]GBE81494.1 hypothetical protein SCP_0312230 [Sparassis crispa]
MVAALERDVSEHRLRRLQLQRSNEALREMLRAHHGVPGPPVGNPSALVGLRRDSIG